MAMPINDRKENVMALNLDVMDRLKSIRKQAQAYPHASADQRLAEIHELSDLSVPFASPRQRMSETLQERLIAGAASRSPRRTAGKPPEKAAKKTDEADPEKKRKKKGGRDRKEGGGYDRVDKSEDINR